MSIPARSAHITHHQKVHSIMFISLKVEYISESLCELVINDVHICIIRIRDEWILTDENGNNTDVKSHDFAVILKHVYDTNITML